MTWLEFRRFPIENDMSDVSAFLAGQSVVHTFTEDGNEQVLWMKNKADMALVSNFLERYERGEIQMRQTATNNILRRPDIVEFAAASPITTLIIVVGFFGYVVGGMIASTDLFKFLAYLPPSSLQHNFELWRLVTPAFVHASVAHFVLNAIWIYIFGRKLEVFLGYKHYIALFLICSIAGNAVQFAMTYSNLFCGLSGVVYGLLGFIGVGKLVYREPLMDIPTSLIVFCMVSMAMGFFGVLDWLTSGGIANWAHLGGFAGGVVYSLVYFLFNKRVNLNP